MYTRWNNIIRAVNVFVRTPSIACNLSVNNASLYKGVDLADKLPTTPRLIKTHLPVQFIPKSFWEQNCRVNAVHTQCFKGQNVASWRKSWLLSFICKLSISASVCLPTQINNIWRFWNDSTVNHLSPWRYILVALTLESRELLLWCWQFVIECFSLSVDSLRGS